MRQIIEVIQERRSVDDLKHRSYIEWQTKVLASFIGSTAMSAEGAKSLQEAASKLSMIPHEEDQKTIASAEPRVGSFEKLSMMFAPR